MACVNGEILANILTSLNCNCDRTLDGSSFDWLFENVELKEFLERFCKAAEFKKIAIVEAHETIKAKSNLAIPLHDLKSHISISENEIQEKQCENKVKEMAKMELKKQQKVLRQEISIVKKEKINSETLKLKVEQDFNLEKENCQLLQKELSEALDSIVVNLTEFINIVECQANDAIVSSKQQNSISSSFLYVEPYLNMEEAYLNSLHGYVDKQFKNEVWGIDNFQSFSGKNSDSGVSIGQSNFFKWKRELCRLKDCLLTSKEKLIRGKVLRETLKEQISLLQEKIAKNVPEQGLDGWQLKLKIEQGSSKLDDKIKQLYFLTKEILPKEILKIVNSILKDVITANYEIKIKRQQYFVDKQAQLFQRLLQQQSRLSLLHIAVQIEARQICQLDHLVRTIVTECGKEAERSQKSVDYMKSLKISGENEAKYLLTPTNFATNILADIIGKNKEELFVSYQSLTTSARDFQRNSKDLKKIIDKNSCEQEILTSQIASGFHSLDIMVSPLVSDCVGSVELKQQLGLLESEIKKLEANLTNISSTFSENVKFSENCEREKLKREELREKFLNF